MARLPAGLTTVPARRGGLAGNVAEEVGAEWGRRPGLSKGRASAVSVHPSLSPAYAGDGRAVDSMLGNMTAGAASLMPSRAKPSSAATSPTSANRAAPSMPATNVTAAPHSPASERERRWSRRPRCDFGCWLIHQRMAGACGWARQSDAMGLPASRLTVSARDTPRLDHSWPNHQRPGTPAGTLTLASRAATRPSNAVRAQERARRRESRALWCP